MVWRLTQGWITSRREIDATCLFVSVPLHVVRVDETDRRYVIEI
jgi:hypothetical protein